MNFSMKKLLSVLGILTALYACQDSRETTSSNTPQFDKSIGKEIPYSVAQRWMNNLTLNVGRVSGAAASVTTKQVTSLITEDVYGLAFHHTLDNRGAYHLVVVPASDTELDWRGNVLDATTGQLISGATATSWASNYATAHSSEIQYHFFGANVFNEIEAVSSEASHVDIEPALNDEGKPQLLLLVWKNNGVTYGRTEAETLMVFDASSPCPPCRPPDED
jgi:hypothetical protein